MADTVLMAAAMEMNDAPSPAPRPRVPRASAVFAAALFAAAPPQMVEGEDAGGGASSPLPAGPHDHADHDPLLRNPFLAALEALASDSDTSTLMVYEHHEHAAGADTAAGAADAGGGALPRGAHFAGGGSSSSSSGGGGGGGGGGGSSSEDAPAFVEVGRAELMRRVRAAIASEEADGIKLFGGAARPLSGWDVHLLDPAAAARPGSAGFQLRRGCVLISMSPLRAVVTQRACFVSPEAGADGELEPLLRLLAARARSSRAAPAAAAAALPLPLVALAAILAACRLDMASDVRAMGAAVDALAAKLAQRRGAEEVLQERLAQTAKEVNALLDRVESVLAAVAAFAATEATHRRSAPAGTVRTRLDAMHEIVAVFGMRVKTLQGALNVTAAHLASRRNLFTLRVSRHRNAILRVGLLLPLISACMAFCSMMSGWFGMNLDNGTCGPDGCDDFNSAAWTRGLAPLPFSASGHGYPQFLALTITSSSTILVVGVVMWLYIRSLF